MTMLCSGARAGVARSGSVDGTTAEVGDDVLDGDAQERPESLGRVVSLVPACGPAPADRHERDHATSSLLGDAKATSGSDSPKSTSRASDSATAGAILKPRPEKPVAA